MNIVKTLSMVGNGLDNLEQKLQSIPKCCGPNEVIPCVLARYQQSAALINRLRNFSDIGILNEHLLILMVTRWDWG